MCCGIVRIVECHRLTFTRLESPRQLEEEDNSLTIAPLTRTVALEADAYVSNSGSEPRGYSVRRGDVPLYAR